MLFNRCPSREQLGEFAQTATPAWIAKHVAGCATCRDQLTELRSNEDLVRDMRTLYAQPADDVDHRKRARLLRLCDDVAKQEGVERPPAGAP